MALRCPGVFTAAQAVSVMAPCPQCARPAEIFGDEWRVFCRCGAWVYRNPLPFCAQSCAEAEDCLASLRESFLAMQQIADEYEQRERFRQLQEQVEKIVKRCALEEESLQRTRPTSCARFNDAS